MEYQKQNEQNSIIQQIMSRQCRKLEKEKRKTQKVIRDCYDLEKQSLLLYGKFESWMSVLQSRDWSHVRQLCLGGCLVNDSNVRAMTTLDWPTLHKLQFYNNQITARGVESLVKIGWCELELLNLTKNAIGDQGFEMLVSVLEWNFPHLRHLYVEENGITEVGMKIMPGYQFAQLTELILNCNPIGHKGMKLLSKTNLPLLQQLKLNCCNLQNEGSRHLTKSCWPQLQKISLNGNHIKIDGVEALPRNSWNKLKQLVFWSIEPIEMMGLISANWVNAEIMREILNCYYHREIRRVVCSRKWK